MAQVKFSSGNISSLPTSLTEGQVYFAITDEEGKQGQIIFDKDSAHRYIMSNSPFQMITFSTCATDGDINEKEIIISQNNAWVLKEGSSLFVKFVNTNTAKYPTFTVKNAFGKIYCQNVGIIYDSKVITVSMIDLAGKGDNIIHYVYDGKYFNFVGRSYLDKLVYNVATSSSKGLIKPWKSYTKPSVGPTESTEDKTIYVNNISSVNGRYYALEMDSEGRGFVNVPWESGSGELKSLQPLRIGTYTYDGTTEVNVPIYDGT